MGFELEGMGRLVERDPGPHVGQWHVQLTRQAADVLLDEEQTARPRLRGQQRHVVLAQDARAQEAEHEADLARDDDPVRQGGEAGAEARVRRSVADERALEPGDEVLKGADVGGCPAGTVDNGMALDDAGQGRPEARLETRHDAIHRRRPGGLAGRELVGGQAARRATQAGGRDGLGGRPVDEPSGRSARRGGRPSDDDAGTEPDDEADAPG